MSKSSEYSLHLLIQRLETVEKRLFTDDRETVNTTSRIIDGVYALNEKLRQLTSGREKYLEVNQRLKSLSDFIDTVEFHDPSFDQEALFETVLTHEMRIQEITPLLDDIVEKQSLVDRQLPITDDIEEKINSIKEITIKQKAESDEIEIKRSNLFIAYNKLLHDIKNQLLAMDLKISALESRSSK